MKLLIKLLLFFTIFGINYSFATIDLTVSPIKYELELNPGESITKIATLQNRGNNDLKIITGKSDFVAKGTSGNPKFVRYSELVHSDQQLSKWITLTSSGFTINANSKKEINFTIDVPENATPGGHYGAVFFKNNNSEKSSSNGNNVGINVDYGIIILVKVKGDIITDINIDSDSIEIIDNNGGNSNSNNKGGYSKINNLSYNLLGNGNKNLVKKDNCLIDFTNSNYDGKCFDNKKNIIKIATGEETKNNKKDNNNLTEKGKIENKDNNENNFNILFKIPVENKGNTHVKTMGEIKLFDEDGKQIKQIGKQIIVNDKGAIIGEKIVDYVPINDNRGNVLPGTKRIFNTEWKGFPYKKYSQEEGKEIIEYKSPGEYYSDISEQQDLRVMPWERICYDKQTKKIKAKFDIGYIDEKGNEVSLPSAKEFNITYTRKYIGYNYYFIFGILFIILSLFILIWLILLLNKKKCINRDCKRRIKRNEKICPYCLTNQKDKSYKKNKIKNFKKEKKKTKKEK